MTATHSSHLNVTENLRLSGSPIACRGIRGKPSRKYSLRDRDSNYGAAFIRCVVTHGDPTGDHRPRGLGLDRRRDHPCLSPGVLLEQDGHPSVIRAVSGGQRPASPRPSAWARTRALPSVSRTRTARSPCRAPRPSRRRGDAARRTASRPSSARRVRTPNAPRGGSS
jgi:hypothetical protein